MTNFLSQHFAVSKMVPPNQADLFYAFSLSTALKNQASLVCVIYLDGKIVVGSDDASKFW